MGFVMSWEIFCCPICKGTLMTTGSGFVCRVCGRSYNVVEGLPDFFVAESAPEAMEIVSRMERPAGVGSKMTHESLLIAQKPG
jgi:uncharacterized protein YbaR (Trm112 family)